MKKYAKHAAPTHDARETVNSLRMLGNDGIEVGRVVMDSDDSSSSISSSSSSSGSSNGGSERSDKCKITTQQHERHDESNDKTDDKP